MGTTTVKSMEEMRRANRRHFSNIEKVNRNVINRLAVINERVSQGIVRPHSFSNELLSSIDLSVKNRSHVQVIASAPHSQEIEEGLKNPEFRSYSEFPKLAAWVKENFDNFPEEGILVGGPNSKIHPQGLHFMLGGFVAAVEESQNILNQELRIISFGG